MSGVDMDFRRYTDLMGDSYPVFLVEMSHPVLAGVQRVASSWVERLDPWPDGQPRYGVRSTLGRPDGPRLEFTHIGFSLQPPNQEEDGAVEASFTIWRTPELVELFRSQVRTFRFHLYQVWSDQPDVVALQLPQLLLKNPEISGASISGTLGADLREGEPFPAMSFTRRWFPGMR